MNDAVNREGQILAQAAEQDLNRQRQIENQKQSINRLLEANTKLETALTDIQRIVTEAVAEGNNSSYIDRISDVITEQLQDELGG
jgi:cell fate (sporulation/competence/biofilm development) regulator YlbF (YheA/YmcA/DUF963 family)